MAVRIKKNAAAGMLSMTPLIDVLFMLLIFFLVATKFADEDYSFGFTNVRPDVLPSSIAAAVAGNSARLISWVSLVATGSQALVSQ